MYVPQLTHSNLIPRVFTSALPPEILGGGVAGVKTLSIRLDSQVVQAGRDKGRMRMRMADTDADEKIRMRKCGWGIKRGWENADGG